jgi:signal transduction histidine kinase
MLSAVSWVTVVSLLAGGVSLAAIGLFSRYRHRPGGWMWLGVLAAMAVWSTCYGLGTLVFDPTLREWFEYPMYVAMALVGVCYLGFTLEYTGHGPRNRLRWLSVVGSLAVGFVTLALSNSLHGLFWSDYAVTPVFGAATVTYTRGPMYYALTVFVYGCIGVGILFLVETMTRYGRPYRRHLGAIALTPLFPAVAGLIWVFEVGPVPELNLIPLSFLPHVALDVYALFGSEMFEYEPATRRAGERAAIDDIGTPVFVFDTADRLIDWNTAAGEFGYGNGDRLTVGTPVEDILGADALSTEQTVRRGPDGAHREFKLTVSSFATKTGSQGGYTVALQDVTEENQRKERLEVLNRILRHNVRNKCNVIGGYAEFIEERAAHEEVRTAGTTIEETTADLVTLSEKARASAAALGDDTTVETVTVRSLVEGFGGQTTDGRVTLDFPDELTVETRPQVASLVVSNLVENGLEHSDGRVRVTARRTSERDAVVITVEDEGDGVPRHERAVIETGKESPLEHGSGIGLWIARWGAATLGGELVFGDDDSQPVVRVTLPDLRGEWTDHSPRATRQ